MSFKQLPTDVTICSRALGKISESPIESMNAPGEAARACRTWYKPVVAKLLETHHFGLATKRKTLVEMPNDRAVEWTHAYAAPNDMAFPVKLLPYGSATAVNYYVGLAGILGMLSGRKVSLFQRNSGIIYALLGDASLDYVSYDISEADFNATFESLIILFLASQLALAMPKDKKMSDELKNEGVTELNQAIARNLNETATRYGDFVSDSELARGGWTSPIGRDWFPGPL